MSKLTQFLDWLDEAAGGMIRIAYLLAGVTAVAVYFGAGDLPKFVEDALNSTLPWALAFAIETHTYVTARRVRAAWSDKAWGALKVNVAILAGLLSFSAWNQLNYLYNNWIPPVTALHLPIWTSYIIRALVVPLAFMAAAFLAPMAEPIVVQIENEARATLSDVFRIARKQRRRMLAEAEQSGRDMTAALVELVPDLTTRNIISHAYSAIGAPVQTAVATIVESDQAPKLVEGPSVTDDTPKPVPTPTRTLRVVQTPTELAPVVPTITRIREMYLENNDVKPREVADRIGCAYQYAYQTLRKLKQDSVAEAS